MGPSDSSSTFAPTLRPTAADPTKNASKRPCGPASNPPPAPMIPADK